MIPLKKVIQTSTLSVPCPVCHARVGEGCHSALGRPMPIHEERLEVAVKRMGEKLPPMGVFAGVDRRKKA